MRAAVLAGGLGTRLAPYSAILPKPLVPVGDRPILELIFDWLARAGVVRVDVCIGHLGELIQTYFSQPGTIPEHLDVHWVREPEPLGTAGALRLIAPPTDTLLVVNGDIVTDLDPSAEMLKFHRGQSAALTIATHRMAVSTELGLIDHDHGVVIGYREKPVFEYDASMGIYLYEPRAFAALAPGVVQFPEFVLSLLERGERVAAFLSDASWHDIGTLSGHFDATRSFAEFAGKPPLKRL
jgi:NDP-sugar pyrophosphorylase family protein